MDLRLAYRIATMPLAFLQHSQDMDVNDPARIARAKAEVLRIREIPKIVLDNVAKFYAEHPQNFWDTREDVPNWAPPFGEFFVEWNTALQRWSDEEKKIVTWVALPDTAAQTGLMVTAAEVDQLDDASAAELARRIKAMGGSEDYQEEVSSQIRWTIIVRPWLVLVGGPAGGRPLWVDATCTVFVDSKGKCLGHVVSGAAAQLVADATDGSALLEWMMILGLGISFMHCKNVIQKDTVDVRSFKFHRNYKCPKFTFKTLEIEPMKRVLRTEGRSDETGLKKALHICRGHFVTYTEERPLFGRSVGTFWKPDHVRGSADRGIVVKDYDVKMPPSNSPEQT